MNVELAAVLITGFVALATVLIAPIIRLATDRLAWGRKQKAERLQKVEDATRDLLTDLANIHMLAEDGTQLKEFQRDTWCKFLMWERSVWAKSRHDEREQIKVLRKTITRGSADSYREEFDPIVQKILDLTHNVTQRMD